MTTIKAYQLQHLLDGSQVSPPETRLTITGESETNPDFFDWDVLNKQLIICIFLLL